MQGSQFETSVNSGLDGDTSSAIKLFLIDNRPLKETTRSLILEGEDQIIRVDLSVEVEYHRLLSICFLTLRLCILRIQIVATELPQLRQK